MSAGTIPAEQTTTRVTGNPNVRVNLLPEATRQRSRASRQRAYAVAGLAAVVAMIGAGYWYQLERVDAANAERELAREAVATRQAEVTELAAFADLEARLQEIQDALTAAMGDEVSVAGLMQDIAFVTPPDTAITDFDVTAVEDVVGVDGQQTKPAVARLRLAGETLAHHAPGLERVLREYDKLPWFFDPYLNYAEIDDEDPDILLFEFEVDLDESARTGRYAEGLPEELR